MKKFTFLVYLKSFLLMYEDIASHPDPGAVWSRNFKEGGGVVAVWLAEGHISYSVMEYSTVHKGSVASHLFHLPPPPAHSYMPSLDLFHA